MRLTSTLLAGLAMSLACRGASGFDIYFEVDEDIEYTISGSHSVVSTAAAGGSIGDPVVSKWIVEKNLDVRSIVQGIYDRTNKSYGTNERPNQ